MKQEKERLSKIIIASGLPETTKTMLMSQLSVFNTEQELTLLSEAINTLSALPRYNRHYREHLQ